MQTLSLKRNSWHRKLARFYNWEETVYKKDRFFDDGLGYERTRTTLVPNDFCSYVRRIIFGLIFTLGLLIVAVAVATVLVIGEYRFFVYIVYEGLIMDNWYPREVTAGAIIGGAVNVMGAIIGLVYAVSKGYLRIFAIPDWIKWCFKWIPSPKIRIPDCSKIPICDDTRRFIVAAYATFHDKVCFKLSFHEDGAQENDQ